jgi:hypothetical protein
MRLSSGGVIVRQLNAFYAIGVASGDWGTPEFNDELNQA